MRGHEVPAGRHGHADLVGPQHREPESRRGTQERHGGERPVPALDDQIGRITDLEAPDPERGRQGALDRLPVRARQRRIEEHAQRPSAQDHDVVGHQRVGCLRPQDRVELRRVGGQRHEHGPDLVGRQGKRLAEVLVRSRAHAVGDRERGPRRTRTVVEDRHQHARGGAFDPEIGGHDAHVGDRRVAHPDGTHVRGLHPEIAHDQRQIGRARARGGEQRLGARPWRALGFVGQVDHLQAIDAFERPLDSGQRAIRTVGVARLPRGRPPETTTRTCRPKAVPRSSAPAAATTSASAAASASRRSTSSERRWRRSSSPDSSVKNWSEGTSRRRKRGRRR
jgi:hypothetical protein